MAVDAFTHDHRTQRAMSALRGKADGHDVDGMPLLMPPDARHGGVIHYRSPFRPSKGTLLDDSRHYCKDREFHPLALPVVGVISDSGDDRGNRC